MWYMINSKSIFLFSKLDSKTQQILRMRFLDNFRTSAEYKNRVLFAEKTKKNVISYLNLLAAAWGASSMKKFPIF